MNIFLFCDPTLYEMNRLVLVTNIKSGCIWPNVKHSIGGMGLRPLEDLATSQVGLVPPLKSLICICYHNNLYICYITDLYLLPKLFVFVTLHICIYYIKDLLLLHHRFVFVTDLYYAFALNVRQSNWIKESYQYLVQYKRNI